MAEPYLHVQMDAFLDMLPQAYENHPDSFTYETVHEDGKPVVIIRSGSVGERLMRGMRHAVRGGLRRARRQAASVHRRRRAPLPDGEIAVHEGERLTARVVEIDLARGLVRLGKSLGKPGSLAAIEQARAAAIAIEGKVTGVNKGGLEVELGGAPAPSVPSRRPNRGFSRTRRHSSAGRCASS